MTKKKKQTKQHLNVFIGYDERQDLAYRVCKQSLEDTASKPLSIYPLKHRELREIELFKRAWEINGKGLTTDKQDGRPFSTNFAFTRFLVPAYAKYLGTRANDPCIFVDSDFVFLRDIYSILDETSIEDHPVWVVKHDYKSANVIKMDNQSQFNYNKKLWSSFMLFNMKHANCGPSIEDVNTKDGTWLHQFGWLKDEDIGGLHEGWNFIPEHSNKRIKESEIRAIHYTEGVPLMKPGCRYAEVFNNYLRDVLEEAYKDVSKLEDK